MTDNNLPPVGATVTDARGGTHTVLRHGSDIGGTFALWGDAPSGFVYNQTMFSHTLTALWRMQQERDALRELLREVAGSGVESDDPRIGYVTVQIDRDTWRAVREVTA